MFLRVNYDDYISIDTLGVTDTTTAWYYKHDGLNDWVRGEGSSFNFGVADDTEETFTNVRVKTEDIAGNISETILGTITIDKRVDSFEVNMENDTSGSHVQDGDSDKISINGQINVTGVTDRGSVWYYKAEGEVYENILLGSREDEGTLADWGTLNANGSVSIISPDVSGTITAYSSTGELASVAYETGEDFGLGVDANGTGNDLGNEIELNEKIVLEFDDTLLHAKIGFDSLYGDFMEDSIQDARISWKAYDIQGNEVLSGELSNKNHGDNDNTNQTNFINIDIPFAKIEFETISYNNVNSNFVIRYIETAIAKDFQTDWIQGEGTSFVLDEGTYSSVLVKSVDIAGNEEITDFAANADIVIDQTSDEFTMDLNLDTKGEDTGEIGDQISQSGVINVNGIIDSNSVWFYKFNNEIWVQGNGSIFVLPSNTTCNNVQVKSVDIAGNEIVHSLGTIQTDTIVDSFNATLTDTRGEHAPVGDFVTRDNTIEITNVESTSAWYYKMDGSISWILGGHGNGVITLSEGEHTNIQIKTVDVAGNMSDITELGDWTVDMTPEVFTAKLEDDTAPEHIIGGASDQITRSDTVVISSDNSPVSSITCRNLFSFATFNLHY